MCCAFQKDLIIVMQMSTSTSLWGLARWLLIFHNSLGPGSSTHSCQTQIFFFPHIQLFLKIAQASRFLAIRICLICIPCKTSLWLPLMPWGLLGRRPQVASALQGPAIQRLPAVPLSDVTQTGNPISSKALSCEYPGPQSLLHGGLILKALGWSLATVGNGCPFPRSLGQHPRRLCCAPASRGPKAVPDQPPCPSNSCSYYSLFLFEHARGTQEREKRRDL